MTTQTITQAAQPTAEDLDMTPEEMEAWAAMSGATVDASAPKTEDDAAAAAAAEATDKQTGGDGAAESKTEATTAAQDDGAKDAGTPAAQPSEDALRAVAAEDALDLPETQTFQPADTASIGDQIKTLKEQKSAARAEKFDIDAKWLAGDVTDEERRAALAKLDDRLDGLDEQVNELVRQQTKADTIRDIATQQEQQAQLALLNKYKTLGKEAGIDYASKEHGEQFDMAMQISINQGKTFAQAAAQAHRTVLALNGKLEGAAAAAAPAASPAPAPAASAAAPAAAAPAPNRTPPVSVQTLADAPRAGMAPTGQDFMERFASIDDPDTAEAMLAAMPAAQREAIDRSAYAGRR